MGFKEIGPMGLPSRLRGTVSTRGTAIAHTNTTLNLRSPGQEAATMGLPLFLAALNLEREGFNLFTELSKVKKQSRAAVGRDTDQIRALEVAAKMEDFLCGFYADAISQTESQHSKEFFLRMLEMEREHCDLLEDSIANLEKPERVNAA
jgi:hypothetical protein